jgi:hypothetical protein
MPAANSLLSRALDMAFACRYKFILNTLVCQHRPALFVGPTGTGKSVYIKSHLQSGLPAEFLQMNLTFSAQTSANMTQDIVDGNLDKRRKGVYGPPVGHRMVVFVDDLNMPQVEVYGAQPPIELLRQWMDHGGWYAFLLVFPSDCTLVRNCTASGVRRSAHCLEVLL